MLVARCNEGLAWSEFTANEPFEEWLVLEVFVVLFEVLFGCCHELDGDELVAIIGQPPAIAVFVQW